MSTRPFSNGSNLKSLSSALASVADRSALREEAFLHVMWRERKRAERSQKPCVLMLIEMDSVFAKERSRGPLETILSAVSAATRETDVTGWYKEDSVVGVLFTEIAAEEESAIVTAVMNRVAEVLRGSLGLRQFNQVSVSFHLFPEQGDERVLAMPTNPNAYTNLATRDEAGRLVQR